MSFFSELFNPIFFIFLGIIILIVSISFVYFEGKLREQNHKISSMLSLVSTLAEDINGIKLYLRKRNTITNVIVTKNNEKKNTLIKVSDDEGDVDEGDVDEDVEGDVDEGDVDEDVEDDDDTDDVEEDEDEDGVEDDDDTDDVEEDDDTDDV